MIKYLNVVYDQPTDMKKNTISFFDLHNITNGSVQNISCLHVDKIDYKDRKNKIIEILHKSCVNGSISLKFLNLDLLGTKIKKKEVTGKKFSEIINLTRSVWDHTECIEFLSNINKNVSIDTIGFDDIYTIIQLKKT